MATGIVKWRTNYFTARAGVVFPYTYIRTSTICVRVVRSLYGKQRGQKISRKMTVDEYLRVSAVS